MNPEQEVKEQIKYLKSLAENQRKLKSFEIEERKGKDTLRYINEERYAPIIEATKAASEEENKKLTDISVGLEKSNKQIELYKQGNLNVLEGLATQFRGIENALEDTKHRGTVTQRYGAVPDDLLVYLANKSDEALCIAFDETSDPPSLRLGKFFVSKIALNYIVVSGAKFDMTPGAWLLLTRSSERMSEVSEEDKQLYCRLMWKTLHVYADPQNQKNLKSSRSKKWKLLKEYGVKRGFIPEKKSNASTSSETSDHDNTLTGEGLKRAEKLNKVIRYIPDDLNIMINKVYTTVLNVEAGHTNISINDVFLATEILDVVLKQGLISLTAYKNIYNLLEKHLLKL